MSSARDGEEGARRLEAVRKALRQRGYLRTPIDRFLFGGRRPFRSKFGAVAAAALRAAVVGAPIVAALIVLFLIQHNTPHLYRPADLILLYLYALPLAGLMLGFATLAGGVLVGVPDRPRRGLAILPPEPLGFAVAALFGLYIGWRWLSMATGGGGWWPVSTRLLLLATLLVIGIWLGTVVSRALQGQVLHRNGSFVLHRNGSFVLHRNGSFVLHRQGSPLLSPTGRRGWRQEVWAILPVLVVLALLFLYPPVPRTDPGSDAVPIGVASIDRLVVVAIDGLDWHSLPEIWPGRERAIPLWRAEAGEPPAIWTTLVTGHPADRHGVHAVQTLWMAGVAAPLRRLALPGLLRDTLRLLLPGITPVGRRPVNATQRRSRTIWEILADHGRRPAAVNWWATWPAPASGSGVVVSERTYFKLLAGGEADRETRPSALFASLQARFDRPAPVDRDERMDGGMKDSLDADTAGVLMQAWAADRFHIELAVNLLTGRSVDDLFLYLPGLDIVQVQLFGEGRIGSLPQLRHRVEIVEEYLQFLARSLRSVGDHLGEGDLLVLVGDPGRLHPRQGKSGPIPGVLALQGARVSLLTTHPTAADGFDLMPTLLHLRGFPAAADMPGRSLLVDGSEPPVPIASYGSPDRGPSNREESPFDEELLEQLRGLGYLD